MLKIWNRHTDACVRSLVGHQDVVLCLQHDEKRILSGSKDKTVREWKIASSLTTEEVSSPAPTPQRKSSLIFKTKPVK
jgi:WD40 repeat protein